MTISMAVFTFINSWFISLLFAFPFHVESAEPGGEHDGYAAAPKKIHWKKILLTATVAAVVFTVVLALVIKSGIVPVKHMY